MYFLPWFQITQTWPWAQWHRHKPSPTRALSICFVTSCRNSQVCTWEDMVMVYTGQLLKQLPVFRGLLSGDFFVFYNFHQAMQLLSDLVHECDTALGGFSCIHIAKWRAFSNIEHRLISVSVSPQSECSGHSDGNFINWSCISSPRWNGWCHPVNQTKSSALLCDRQPLLCLLTEIRIGFSWMKSPLSLTQGWSPVPLSGFLKC